MDGAGRFGGQGDDSWGLGSLLEELFTPYTDSSWGSGMVGSRKRIRAWVAGMEPLILLKDWRGSPQESATRLSDPQRQAGRQVG